MGAVHELWTAMHSAQLLPSTTETSCHKKGQLLSQTARSHMGYKTQQGTSIYPIIATLLSANMSATVTFAMKLFLPHVVFRSSQA